MGGEAILGGVVLAAFLGWGIYRNYKLHSAWRNSFSSEEGNALWRFCCRRGWHQHGGLCKQGDLAIAKASLGVTHKENTYIETIKTISFIVVITLLLTLPLFTIHRYIENTTVMTLVNPLARLTR